jgi:hypothetical protein
VYRKVVGEKKRGLHRRIKIAYPCSKFVETERFLKILSYFPSKIELIQNVPQLFEKIHIEKMLNPAMGHKTFSKQKQTSHLKISEPIPFDWSGVSRHKTHCVQFGSQERHTTILASNAGSRRKKCKIVCAAPRNRDSGKSRVAPSSWHEHNSNGAEKSRHLHVEEYSTRDET